MTDTFTNNFNQRNGNNRQSMYGDARKDRPIIGRMASINPTVQYQTFTNKESS